MADLPQTQLDQLNAFVAVAEHGGFAAASRHLGRDSSVITRRIAALEKRLGIRLIERTTRRMAFTEAGAAYLQRVRGVLEELALADAEAAALNPQPRGLLRLSLPQAYGRLCVAPLLPAFLAAHPAVDLEVRYTDRFADLVAEGIDLAVRLGQLRDSGLVARPLARFERGLYASPAYLRRHGRPQTPAELRGHAALALLSHDRPGHWTLHRGAERVQVQLDVRIASDDVVTLLQAAAADTGLVVATDWLLRGHDTTPRLQRLLPDWNVGPTSAIHAVTPTARLLPGKTRALLEFLTGHLKS